MSDNKVQFFVEFKDPDLPERFVKQGWGEFGEYYRCFVEVDTETGKGRVAFERMGKREKS